MNDKVCQNMRKCAKSWESEPKHEKVSQNMRKWAKSSECMRKCDKTETSTCCCHNTGLKLVLFLDWQAHSPHPSRHSYTHIILLILCVVLKISQTIFEKFKDIVTSYFYGTLNFEPSQNDQITLVVFRSALKRFAKMRVWIQALFPCCKALWQAASSVSYFFKTWPVSIVLQLTKKNCIIINF